MASVGQRGLRDRAHSDWLPAGVCVIQAGLPLGCCQPREGTVDRTWNEGLGLDSVSSPPLHVSRPQFAGAQLVRRELRKDIPLCDASANVPAARVISLLQSRGPYYLGGCSCVTGDFPRRSLRAERDLENVSRGTWQRPAPVPMVDEQTRLGPAVWAWPADRCPGQAGRPASFPGGLLRAGVLRDRVCGSLGPLRLDRPAPARAILALPDLVGRVTGRTLPDP